MKSNERFIKELLRIVNGALRLDTGKVRNYTAHLADKLENTGDKASADRLRKALAETDNQLRPTDVRFQKALPVDSESRFPLLEHVPVAMLNEPSIHLRDPQWDVVHEFLSIANSHVVHEDDALTGSLSFMLYGPPGTGKSRLARYLAEQLGLDLYVARLDGLISSFLGSTSKNMRAMFEFASSTPCVLFLDEFDAIAKLRGDTQELGELKRVVNSFLQNLDTVGRDSVIVAATNHEQLLDSAIWRRFTYRLHLLLPDHHQRAGMWNDFLGSHAFSERDMGVLVDLSEGLSGSDIHEICTRLKRLARSTGQSIDLNDVFPVLRNLAHGGPDSSSFISTLSEDDHASVAKALRDRDSKRYSYALLGRLLNVSKATAFRLVQPEGSENGA